MLQDSIANPTTVAETFRKTEKENHREKCNMEELIKKSFVRHSRSERH
jgi:hypothetical protein